MFNPQLNILSMLSSRFNIPQGMNDPNAILQHLLNTGQVSQEQLNNAMQFGQMLGNSPR